MNIKMNNIIRLLKYIKPYWYLILAATVTGIIKLTLPLALPRVLKYFTDNIIVSNVLKSHEKIDEILKWSITLLFMYIFIYIPASFLRQACSVEVSNRIMHTMRCQLYSYLQKMSATFHHNNKSGNLITRINNDIEKVHDFVWSVATNIWIDSIMIVIYLSFMFSINFIMTIIAVFSLPISILITKKIRKCIRQESKKVQNSISEVAGYTQERMSGFATVKLFNMEDYERKKFNKYSKLIYKFTRKTNHYFSLGEAIASSMSEIISLIIICLSSIYIVLNKITIGDMIVFYTYLGYFVTPIRRFAELNVIYARSMAGIERVFEILDTPLDIKEKDNAIKIDNNIPMKISFNHLWFKYDKKNEDYILSDINFDINEGESIALVGSSGCGKTTLVSLLTRFYDVDKGSINISGKDIREYSLKSLYENIGMVFQDTILFSETIEENIRYGKLDASINEIISAAKSANAYNFIMNTPEKFNTILGERGIGLSGGQKQRIAIARVFLKNPRLLILDEATSALDSESEELVQEALEYLMKGRTSIIIAHRLSTIVNADKIIVMDNGKIVEIGNHNELIKKDGRYSELYHMQFKDIIK